MIDRMTPHPLDVCQKIDPWEWAEARADEAAMEVCVADLAADLAAAGRDLDEARRLERGIGMALAIMVTICWWALVIWRLL